MKRRMNGKGSVTIEAVIFLPIFIISIFTIGFIMKLYWAQECLQHALSNEVVKKASEAYLDYKICPEGFSSLLGMTKNQDIQNQLSEDVWGSVDTSKGQRIIEYRYLFDGRHEDYLIEEPYYIEADYLIEVVSMSQVKMPFSIEFVGDIFLTQRVVARGWVGTEKHDNPMNFEEMSETYKGETVYVFPRAGERYHHKSCFLISNYPTLKLLTSTIKKNYHPCKLCEAVEIVKGSPIYIFEKSGQVYHARSCALVDKYIISIELVDAETKGYTPCKKCSSRNLHN